jgi:hypothetical protein
MHILRKRFLDYGNSLRIIDFIVMKYDFEVIFLMDKKLIEESIVVEREPPLEFFDVKEIKPIKMSVNNNESNTTNMETYINFPKKSISKLTN